VTKRFCGQLILLCVDLILAGVMTPNITDAPPGSDANKLGQAAWGVRTELYHYFKSFKTLRYRDMIIPTNSSFAMIYSFYFYHYIKLSTTLSLQVLSKNYYFSEKDKSYIANTIARRLIQIEACK
jgi:hypothetical protein